MKWIVKSFSDERPPEVEQGHFERTEIGGDVRLPPLVQKLSGK